MSIIQLPGYHVMHDNGEFQCVHMQLESVSGFAGTGRYKQLFGGRNLLCLLHICSSNLCTEGTALIAQRSVQKLLRICRAWCLWHHPFPPLFLPTCSWRHQNCGCRRSGTEGQPWSRASWSFPCALGSTRVVNLGRAMGDMLNMSARRAGSAVIRHNEAGLLQSCQVLLSTDCRPPEG